MSTDPIDPAHPPKAEYCIPVWMRDEQIKSAIARPIPRLAPHTELRDGPIACVGYGPSLNDTWEQVKAYPVIMSCSGSHKFLLARGIVPTYHLEVDPREHKVELLGPPHPDVHYLVASTCHPKYFDHLKGHNVTLWHVFDNSEESQRLLPHGEWSITGGCSVGVRMLTLSRFLGYRELHVFGMDGSEHETHGKHAAVHPMQPAGHRLVTVHGRTFKTTASMFAVANGIWHELNELRDVTATFYGDGLIQHMAQFYVKDLSAKPSHIAMAKPEVISAEYKALNAQLHRENLTYGVGGAKHAATVTKLVTKIGATSVLDYGCGKGLLAKELSFPIWEYDPAIPGKDLSPRPADLVICTDVLEHIEPDKLMAVLSDLKRVVKKVGYFTIHTGPARKTLPDGRNTHLIQQHRQWWKNRLKVYFDVGMMKPVGPELHCIVSPKVKAPVAA